MNLVSEIKDYLDDLPVVTIDKNPTISSTGNGFLHLGFLRAYLDVAKIPKEDIDFKFAYEKSLVTGYRGLFHRNPYKADDELNSWDEYLGMATVSAHEDKSAAFEIINYGLANNFYYDNQTPKEPKLASWHDRFMWLVPYYALCAGLKMQLIDEISIALYLFISSFSKHADVHIRSFCVYSVCRKSSLILQLFSLVWYQIVKLRYSSLGEAVKPYFKENHPLSKLQFV